MEELVFFDHGPVKVTSARFIVDDRTYAMNGVTSVKSSIKPPDRVGPLVVILIGLLMVFAVAGMTMKLIGLLVAGFGVWIWTQQKNTYAVFLSSASGEVQALSNTDEAYIGGVIRALNESLVHRG
jgi:hypothetical protein